MRTFKLDQSHVGKKIRILKEDHFLAGTEKGKIYKIIQVMDGGVFQLDVGDPGIGWMPQDPCVSYGVVHEDAPNWEFITDAEIRAQVAKETLPYLPLMALIGILGILGGVSMLVYLSLTTN